MHDAAGIWAVLPVKPLAEGKSRLELPPAERIACNRHFYQHVLATLMAVIRPERIVIVSRDAEVLRVARRAGARALTEDPEGDLNDAVTAGAIFAARRGARAVLTIATDLPDLGEDDLVRLIAAHTPAGAIVIAPDSVGAGTNALLMQPLAIPYRYGTGSFWAHLNAVRGARHRIAVVRTAGLAEDVDWPADLARARGRGLVPEAARRA
jgi:2-phospho-L-lactate/phosphoenolpyruvate guanylyltransferase